MTPQDYIQDLFDDFVDAVDDVIDARGKIDMKSAGIAREEFDRGFICLQHAMRPAHDEEVGVYFLEVKMDFGKAVQQLKRGRRVARKGWNGKNMYLELQVPDEHSKMTLPYIYMRTANGQFVPWLASQSDMLEDDWVIVSPLPRDIQQELPLNEGEQQ